MGKRDDFKKTTIQRLASRVAYRCSYAGCNTITIGPGVASNDDVVILGEAAHITAAAAGGPRYDKSLTREERRRIDNGIWMCRHHARLVDKDELNYSVATLQNWKQLAESRTADTLKQPGWSQQPVPAPTTLIAFGFEAIARGVWMLGERDRWRFKIEAFIRGNTEVLRRYIEEVEKLPQDDRFIIVASQGDGRLIAGPMRWEQSDDGAFEVTVPITPRPFKRRPETFGMDLAWSEGDFVMENGDLKVVSGLQSALQRLQIILDTPRGTWNLHPAFGSLWVEYYREYKEDPLLLEALFKLDLARLATIPHADTVAQRMDSNYRPSAPLSFIERVQEIHIREQQQAEKDILLVCIDLILADGEPWTGEVKVRVTPMEESMSPPL